MNAYNLSVGEFRVNKLESWGQSSQTFAERLQTGMVQIKSYCIAQKKFYNTRRIPYIRYLNEMSMFDGHIYAF